MKNHETDLKSFLLDAMIGGPDFAADRRRSSEQAKAATSKTLPIRFLEGERERLVYEALGFSFGAVVDRLFREATFPAGWGTRRTDHYLYTDICDDRGRRRGRYLYKSDFGDTDAWLSSAETRFRLDRDFSDERRDERVVRVLDSRREIHRTAVRRIVPRDGERIWEARERVEDESFAEARAWLRTRFPEHENPLAYWELPDELDLSDFPDDYVFSAEGPFVSASHLPTGVLHSFTFRSDGCSRTRQDHSRGPLRSASIVDSPPTLLEGFDPALREKARAWAAMIANQPKNPRPEKSRTR